MWKTLLSSVVGFFSGNVLTYLEIGLAVVVLFCVGYTPWHWEHTKFVNYKAQQQALVTQQEVENKQKDEKNLHFMASTNQTLSALAFAHCWIACATTSFLGGAWLRFGSSF